MVYLELPLLNYKDSMKLGYNEIKNFIIPASLRNSYYYYYSSAPKKIGDNGVHVYAPLPIRVYAFSGGKNYSCGATAVYPTATQPPGGVYYPYKARYYWAGPGSSYKVFFFTVVAIDDSVTVSFTSNTSGLWNLPPGNKVLLRKGQLVRIYTYILGVDPTLAVTASTGKRISVFTENFYDYAQNNCFSYDLMYEQILPDNILGTDFILTPFRYHKKGYDFTVTATVANTVVKQDNTTTLATLGVGETYYGRIYSDSSVLISANNPINCWEKTILDTCNTGSWGFFNGPSIMTISTTTQMITDAVVSVPQNSSYKINYVNIITTKYGKDSCWLDGTRIAPAAFTSILNGAYYLFRDTLLKGNHRISCNYGFISYLYGRGQYGGYAYNGSAGLASLKRYITSKTYQSCDTAKIVRVTSEGDPAGNYQWTFNGKTDTGLVAYFQVPKAGIYGIKLKYKLARNNQWDSIYSTVEIKGNTAMDFISGSNLNICNTTALITLPKTKLFRYKWSNGDTTHKLTITTSGKYSLIVTNTQSGCKFYDTAQVNLYAKMSPGFTVSMKKTCPGYPIILKNTTTFGGTDSASGYKWYVDNIYHNKYKHDTVKHTFPGTYNIRMVVTSKKGCSDSTFGSIKVGAAPTLISGHNTYDSCYARASYKFNSRSSLSLGKIAGYQWVFSDGDTTYKKQQALRTFHDSGLYWYQISAYSDAGCADTTPKKYFKIYGAPSPLFAITDSSVCKAGNYFTVKNKSSTYGKTARYEWMWGDGSGETFDEPGFKNYTDTGKFKIRLVAAYLSTNCSDTFDRWVRVLPNPKAALLLDSSNFCLNNNYFAFRENSDAKGSTVRYATWKWGDGTQTKDSLKFRKKYTKTGTFKVTLYFSTGKGCLDSAKKNIVVYPSPTAKIAIPDSNICNKTNYFNLANASTAPANAKWAWDYGNGSTSVAKTPGKVSYLTYGKFKIRLVVNDPLYSCYDTAYRYVTVLTSPKMDGRLSDTLVCDTSSAFTFTDSTKYGNLKPWRMWKINTIDTTSKSTLQRKFKTAGYQNIQLVGGLAGVCTDTANYKVHILYTRDVVSISKTVIYPCIGATIDLNANVKQGVNWNYYWDPSSGVGYATQTVTGVKYLFAGKNLILLKVTDVNNCSYTLYDSFTSLPAPDLSIQNLTTDTQCIGGNAFSFSNTLTNATAPISYNWILGESNVSSISKPNIVKYLTTGNKNISLGIVDKNGCRDTAIYGVYVNPSPKVNIASDSMCLGDSRIFNTTITPANIAVNKTDWYINNLYASTSNSYKYVSTGIGKFKIKAIVTATGGCKDTSSSADVTVFAIPVAKFGVTLFNAIGTGVPVDFNDSSIGATKWTWYPISSDRNNFSNSKKFNYLYATLGDANALLVVENSAGCKDSAWRNFTLKSDELVWFPNTFTPDANGRNDVFKPEGLSAVKTYYMSVFNRWGAKVFETNNPMQGWDGTYQNQPALPGAYIYSVNIVFLTGKRLVLNNNLTLLR